MVKKLKIILIFLIICLIGVGVFSFLNIQKKESAQTKTTPNLKLLTSHSSPQAGENWVVYFETTGASDLIITPKDKDSTEDLDFVSLTCESEEINPEIQAGDVLFVSNWSCDGVGVVTHLVNIARKHTLKFQFGEKLAFAYNNPDSVTDSFTDESKIAATSSVTVSSGQVKLSTLKANGESCSSGSECSSTFCVDSVCCNNICDGTPCYRCDSYSISGAGTCGYASSSAVDPDNECPGAFGTCAATTCSGSSNSCGYLSGNQTCGTCKDCTGSSYSCTNVTNNTDPYAQCGGSSCCGYCSSGVCANVAAGSTCSSPGNVCTATHYRCNGSGSCTAPCTNIGCLPIEDPYMRCSDMCNAYAGNCCGSCITSWGNITCTTGSATCSTLGKPYCRAYYFDY